MKFRTLPIAAILFVAVAMVVQFAISSSLEKDHVREVVEYKMQLAQKDFFHILVGFDPLLEMLNTCQQPIDDRTVYDVVCRFSAGAEQADDIAIMSVTRK